VANHVGSILGKLHLASRVQAALWVIEEMDDEGLSIFDVERAFLLAKSSSDRQTA
jgi:hypothetical protein